jgi:hypothetical protein
MKINYEFYKKSGIYCIENIINNKKYIGSSVNIYQRLHKHRTFLIRNKHKNSILQNSVNKNGIENFRCYILEEVTIENLIKREQYYINVSNSIYNVVRNVIRVKIAEETKIKISNVLKQKYISGNLKLGTAKKPIFCINVKTNEKFSFESVSEAQRFTKVSYSTIRRIINGLHKPRKFKFSYSPL